MKSPRPHPERLLDNTRAVRRNQRPNALTLRMCPELAFLMQELVSQAPVLCWVVLALPQLIHQTL